MDIISLVSDARIVVTALCMLTFLGIIAWAYSARRKNDFEEAAMLPFADDEMNTQSQEPRHG